MAKKKTTTPRRPARGRSARGLRGVESDHRELFASHLKEAHARMVDAERAARDGQCHKVVTNLVAAGAEHGIALAHADQVRDPALRQRSERIATKLNLLVDTIGFQCTRPRR